ncbi:hypothetical protein H7X68_03710 [Candidatus Saccharibacteria bacterium]|nr:hypothetical protein [Candidatus Saccharibacteria bacterium]
MYNHKKEHGAVSLFVVIFAALLITVVAVSFIRIMVRDQQQASTVDLSQSAYDSAQAGTEDAKRALLRYQSICSKGSAAECSDARDKVGANECNAGLDGIVTPVNNEVQVQQDQSPGDIALDQAYTCVKVTLDTPDYLGVLQANASKVIPLVSKNPFNKIRLEWYTSKNLQTDNNFDVDLLPETSGTPLLAQSSWKPNRPSIMRTQLMQFGSNFTLGSFDDTNAGQSNVNTLFLYPTGVTGAVNPTIDARKFIERDIRKTPTDDRPLPISCSGSLTSVGYACSVDLELPDSIGAGTRTAFLRLSSIYNATNYRLTLSQDAVAAPFDGVQPQIDATGRANDLFRRVQSRVETVDANFPYPDAAVDITGNFCKYFLITDDVNNYLNSCTP